MQIKRIFAMVLAAMLCTGAQAAELKTGDRGGSVLKVQNELYARGFLTEEGDGRYGKNTESAVRAFQQENGLEATGIVDDETMNLLLYSGDALNRKLSDRLTKLGYLSAGGDFTAALKQFQQFNALEPTGEADDITREALMDSGAVKRAVHIQKQLIYYGYLSGKADGIFGDASKAALAQFQAANGLEATGEIDEASIALLLGGEAVGDDVRMVQQRLISLGYLSGTADGQFGAKSVSALKKFQKLHGLPETGEIDEASRKALFSSDAQRVYPTLNSATPGDAVAELQRRLVLLGYLDGAADGDYGRKTYTAVLNLEKRLAALGMETTPDGEADPEIQRELFSDGFSGYLADLNPGDEGLDALRVERRLRALGYMDAKADEAFDAYASDCLAAFQTAAGLAASGIADADTMTALFSETAPAAKQYVLRDVREGDSGELVRAAQNALTVLGLFNDYHGHANGVYGSETEAALAMLYDYLLAHNPRYAEQFSAMGMLTANGQRVLQNAQLAVYAADIDENAEVSEIERVQRRLRGLLFEVDVDGVYGATTRSAVESFQQINDLPVSGVADEKTQEKLFSATAVGNWTQYMLWVSLDEQRVYVYELDENRQYAQIDKFICSTGLEEATPRGIYTSTTEPLNRWHYFVEYECWAQYSWRIIGNYYFHSILYDEQDEDTIRWGSVYALGYKASHGCIRLEVDAAKWIYENCDAGTIVVIN